VLSHCIRYARETVTRQIHEPLPVPQAEEIHELRPAWRLAGACKLPPIHDYVDSARFSGIRPARHGNLDTVVRNELTGGVRARDKPRFRVMRHGGMPGGFCV